MKNIVTYFMVVLFLLLSCFFRYDELTANWSNLIIFSILFLLYASILYFFIGMYKQFLNPATYYSPFVILYLFSKFINYAHPNSSVEFRISDIIILLSIIFFHVGLATHKIKSFINLKIITKFLTEKNYVSVLIIFGFIAFIAQVIKIGYVPILEMGNKDVYNDINHKLLNFVFYFILLFTVLPGWSYILYKKNNIKKKQFIFVLSLSLIILLNFLSRQNIILLLLVIYFVYSFYNKIKIRGSIFFIIGILVIFLGIGLVRVSSINSEIGYNDYLREAANIETKTNLLETYLYLYGIKNFQTLEQFTNRILETNYFGYGAYTFKPIIAILFLDRTGIISYRDDLNSFNSLATYAIEPFLDFGILGVVVINFIYGYLHSLSFKKFVIGEEKWIIPYAMLTYCNLMSIFTNFYNTFFVWMVLLINFIIFSRRKNERQSTDYIGHI